MKLECFEGCNFSSTIDEKEVAWMEEKEIENILIPTLIKLIKNETDLAILQEVFIKLVENQGQLEEHGYCDQCNSNNYSYTLEIE